MFVKTVNLWENAPGEYEKAPTLDVFIPEKKTSDIAVVVPMQCTQIMRVQAMQSF